MKKYLLSIMLFLLPGVLKLNAQAVLHADTTAGCGNFIVNLTIEPEPDADTISSILWDFGNGETVSGTLTASVVYDDPGIYRVTALVNESSSLTLPETVRVYPDPDPEFLLADSVAAGDHAFVFRSLAGRADSLEYLCNWSFGDGDTATGRTILHVFNSAGNYPVSLTLLGPPGCTATHSVSLQVSDLLELPNIFTPNGDGRNDYFRVRTNGEDVYSFSVYSRAGILIFRSESPVIMWDGRSFSGEEMRNGIYYFTICQLNGEDRVQKKGFVHLVR